ncbi:hypothetical protein C8J55DRAFT_488180 [Lentinula edodes]|uniref:F-box domain-containing protein n=1 Tax=Lentinula lateritia TaxID=40482 RepID=A0A9W9DSK5_9AGAR|nr:hypothetical protein C8J55DRAFT_488180 [Lentinula edodes]
MKLQTVLEQLFAASIQPQADLNTTMDSSQNYQVTTRKASSRQCQAEIGKELNCLSRTGLVFGLPFPNNEEQCEVYPLNQIVPTIKRPTFHTASIIIYMATPAQGCLDLPHDIKEAIIQLLKDEDSYDILQYMLVCKDFNHLFSPYLGRIVCLKSSQQIHQYFNAVTRNPRLRSLVVSFSIDTRPQIQDQDTCQRLISQTTAKRIELAFDPWLYLLRGFHSNPPTCVVEFHGRAEYLCSAFYDYFDEDYKHSPPQNSFLPSVRKLHLTFNLSYGYDNLDLNLRCARSLNHVSHLWLTFSGKLPGGSNDSVDEWLFEAFINSELIDEGYLQSLLVLIVDIDDPVSLSTVDMDAVVKAARFPVIYLHRHQEGNKYAFGKDGSGFSAEEIWGESRAKAYGKSLG